MRTWYVAHFIINRALVKVAWQQQYSNLWWPAWYVSVHACVCLCLFLFMLVFPPPPGQHLASVPVVMVLSKLHCLHDVTTSILDRLTISRRSQLPKCCVAFGCDLSVRPPLH